MKIIIKWIVKWYGALRRSEPKQQLTPYTEIFNAFDRFTAEGNSKDITKNLFDALLKRYFSDYHLRRFPNREIKA